MENKLELKHLSCYLPYGLKMKRNGFIGKLLTIKQPKEDSLVDYYEFQVSTSDWWENNVDDLNPYKPILRPLSELTKEIEVNGEKFVPLIKLWEKDANTSFKKNITCDFKQNHIYSLEREWTLFVDDTPEFHFSQYSNGLQSFRYANKTKKICLSNYNQFEKLFEWHFDVFGLIEKELAIDLNSLK